MLWKILAPVSPPSTRSRSGSCRGNLFYCVFWQALESLENLGKLFWEDSVASGKFACKLAVRSWLEVTIWVSNILAAATLRSAVSSWSRFWTSWRELEDSMERSCKQIAWEIKESVTHYGPHIFHSKKLFSMSFHYKNLQSSWFA